MQKFIRKLFAISSAAILSCTFLYAAKRDVDKYVYTKYANAQSGAQSDWGAINCHDPKIFQDDDGTYYVYSTDAAVGGAGQKGVQIRSSTDLVHWTSLAQSAIQHKWDKSWLKWVNFNMSNASTWAPTVFKQNGLYYMFHGIITDSRSPGYPDAAITMAISSSATGPFYPAATAVSKDEKIKSVLESLNITYTQSMLVRYGYYDRSFDFDADESITEFPMNNTGTYDTYNEMDADINSMSYGFGCIDPEFVIDVSTGKNVEFTVSGRKCYGITYGSWKGGIALMYVDKVSLKPVNSEGKEMDAPADSESGAFGKLVAGGFGAAYEGAQLIYNSENGWYYVFVSMGNLDNEYRVGVGRSKEVYGPYLDGSGRNMKLEPMVASDYHEIGSKIMGGEQLKGDYGWRCPGGESILRTKDGKVVFACHSRTSFLPGFFFFLQVRQMFFTKEGWPVLNHNEYYADENFKEELAPLTAEDVAGAYNAILTVRGNTVKNYTPYGATMPAEVHYEDAVPTDSKELLLNKDGTVGGKNYSGAWTLASDGYSIKVDLKTAKGKSIGTFNGYVLKAVDWALKTPTARKTVTFTTFDGEKTGEYFWGNKIINNK